MLRKGTILGGNGEITVEWRDHWNELKSIFCAQKEGVIYCVIISKGWYKLYVYILGTACIDIDTGHIIVAQIFVEH